MPFRRQYCHRYFFTIMDSCYCFVVDPGWLTLGSRIYMWLEEWSRKTARQSDWGWWWEEPSVRSAVKQRADGRKVSSSKAKLLASPVVGSPWWSQNHVWQMVEKQGVGGVGNGPGVCNGSLELGDGNYRWKPWYLSFGQRVNVNREIIMLR